MRIFATPIRLSILLAAIIISVNTHAGMVAITINTDMETAILRHEKAGAVVQVIPCQDENYPTTIRAKYKDKSRTFLVTDVIASGENNVSKQVIVCKNADALRGLATWFNQQDNYSFVSADKWKTEVDGESVVVYFEPVDLYGEGIIIEKERFK